MRVQCTHAHHCAGLVATLQNENGTARAGGNQPNPYPPHHVTSHALPTSTQRQACSSPFPSTQRGGGAAAGCCMRVHHGPLRYPLPQTRHRAPVHVTLCCTATATMPLQPGACCSGHQTQTQAGSPHEANGGTQARHLPPWHHPHRPPVGGLQRCRKLSSPSLTKCCAFDFWLGKKFGNTGQPRSAPWRLGAVRQPASASYFPA